MKHTLKVTLVLVLFFFLAQVIGLAVTNNYIDHQTTIITGNITWVNLPYGFERPEGEGSTAVSQIIIAILVGTLLLLLIIKMKKVNWIRFAFLFSVFIGLYFAFNAFMPKSLKSILLFQSLNAAELIAGSLAIVIAYLKIYKPNIFIHNLSELFVYGGLAAILVPFIKYVFWGIILLAVISIYDMIAVWKSKHMVKIAKFQASSKVFAGLFIPYKMPKNISQKIVKAGKPKKSSIKTAILGGGDIGFTLIFSGLVMQDLMLKNPELIGFLKSLIIPAFATIALFLLFLKSEKGKFYPAMPFLSIGCIVGYLVILLIG